MNAKLLDREELVFSILDFMTIELPADLNKLGAGEFWWNRVNKE
jgi:hypothetical protein